MDVSWIGQLIQPNCQQFFALHWSALKKPSWEISCIFLQSHYQLGMKNAVKYWKDFLLYFTSSETYYNLQQQREINKLLNLELQNAYFSCSTPSSHPSSCSISTQLVEFFFWIKCIRPNIWANNVLICPLGSFVED